MGRSQLGHLNSRRQLQGIRAQHGKDLLTPRVGIDTNVEASWKESENLAFTVTTLAFGRFGLKTAALFGSRNGIGETAAGRVRDVDLISTDYRDLLSSLHVK